MQNKSAMRELNDLYSELLKSLCPKQDGNERMHQADDEKNFLK